ncbi:MAG TPA: PQQ-binding-like beta-propeller repeat protein [Spirillospora sp.]
MSLKKKAGGSASRWASLFAVLTLVLSTAACGGKDDSTLLWVLSGREVAAGKYLAPVTWATGDVFAITWEREVTGYDAATGRRRWSVPLGGIVCTGTAHASGGVVVVQFGMRESTCEKVAAIDLRNGAKVWERTVVREGRGNYGQLVIAAGAVIVDWLNGTAALDLGNGRLLWENVDSRGSCAYDGLVGGPALVAGRTCDNAASVRSAHGIDPRSGRVLWTYNAPPGHEVRALLSSRPVVLGLKPDSSKHSVTRAVVLDESGTPRADIDLKGEMQCSVDDPTRCEHVVVSNDTLYMRSRAVRKKDQEFAPVVAFDLATGRVRWGTDNPDGNHLFPVAMDGGRLIAAQPGTAGRRGGTPPRLVSVDPATGKTKILWELTKSADFPLRSGSHRQYAGGRLFLTEHVITSEDDAPVLAYGLDKINTRR